MDPSTLTQSSIMTRLHHLHSSHSIPRRRMCLLNIICNFCEDFDQQRYFWLCEVWGVFRDMEVKELILLGNEDAARWAQSRMILDTLHHTTDMLKYFMMHHNQSMFNFCVIPAMMAMATLNLGSNSSCRARVVATAVAGTVVTMAAATAAAWQ